MKETEFWKQDGGIVLIPYEGLMIGAPRSDILQAIKLLKETDNRNGVVESVKRSIKQMAPQVKNGTISQEDALNFGQDMSIWYGNEILEGRALLEETVGNKIQ